MSGLFQDDPTHEAPAQDLEAPPLPQGPGLFGGTLPVALPAPVHVAPYRVLARKYRPATFDDLIGQEAMVRTLRNAFAIGRVAHAFMLTGVRGVGKTTTARIIARALNCIGPNGSGGPTADPCGICDNCVAILADRHPDVIEMDAASRTGVGDMRELIEATRFRPMQARAKVFIVDEVHMLSNSAFNALLKTLEEPPPHVKFVFATTELRKVPITVLSRCQRFDLRRVRVVELVQHYGRIAQKEGVAVDPGALDQIARAADGSVRDGLSILDQAIAQTDNGIDNGSGATPVHGPAITAAQVADMLGLADRERVFDLMEAVMAGKPAAALAITDAAFEHGADLGTLLQDLLDLLHTMTRIKSIPDLRDSHDLPEAERMRGARLAGGLTVPVLARAWQMLLKGISEVETAPDRRAAAEMVLIRLCHVSDMPTPGDLVRRLTSDGTAAGSGPLVVGSGSGGVRAITNGAYAGSGSVEAAASPLGSTAMSGIPTAGRLRQNAPMARAPAATAETLSVAAVEPAAAERVAAGPRLASFRDVVALVAEQRQAMLHAHLLHSVHLVRFAPPVIELRPQPEAPRDLASQLAALLSAMTGTRWTIALSAAAGQPTLAEQGNAAATARRTVAADHPLVRAILEMFPGARIDTVHDRTADAYGLPVEAAPEPDIAEPDMPEFAPPDALYFDEDPMEIDP